MRAFDIQEVSGWTALEEETLGTKRKLWLIAPDGRRWLFKYRFQPSTGDDWSEKIAAEIADLVGIPHAVVELATLDGHPGVVVLDFTDHTRAGELVLGNALLLEADPSYPQGGRYRIAQHRVDTVLDVLDQRCTASPDLRDGPVMSMAGAVFVGYLLLDVLISNTDRHHENWGVLMPSDTARGATPVLAPSFDHASSLGQILTDDERLRRLETRDSGFGVDSFVRKARSALYGDVGSEKPLTTWDAFQRAGRRYDPALARWLERLSAVPARQLAEAIRAVPAERMSLVAKRFAEAVLMSNRARLLDRRVS